MKTTTKITQLIAAIDPDDYANVLAPEATELREPDFVDPTISMAVWIGADAAIEIPTDALGRLSVLVQESGWLARTGRMPSEFGITVTLHNDGYQHPAGGSCAYRTWRVLTDTLEG